MVHFYSLPGEIRQMIYNGCLVVGEIHPYSISDGYTDRLQTAQDKTGCDRPAVALLQVSKAIRLEAEPTIYQRNHVHLGRAGSSQRFFERCLNTPERKLWLKSVSVSLGHDDMTRADRSAILDTELALARDDMIIPQRADSEDMPWSETLHDAYSNYLKGTVWPRKVSPLLDHCRLNKLVVSVHSAFCPALCCRIRAYAVLSFNAGFAMGMPERLVIEGFGEYVSASEELIRSWTSRRIADSDGEHVLDIAKLLS